MAQSVWLLHSHTAFACPCSSLRQLASIHTPTFDPMGRWSHSAAKLPCPAAVLFDERLLDNPLPATGGVFAQALKVAPVLVWGSGADEALQRALQVGASGYALLTDPPVLLETALQAVSCGEVWFSPGVATHLLRWWQRAHGVAATLSDREVEVLCLLARGFSNAEIAQELTICLPTVKRHTSSLFRKLGVGSRTEAALWAIRHGFGDADKGAAGVIPRYQRR